MSLKNRFRLLTLTITLGWNCWFAIHSDAQGLGNSPYSSLGIGEFYGESFSDNSGMGQSGVSVGNGFQINNLNPALWVRNRFTTLDFGLIGQYKKIDSGKNRQTNVGGNLAYVALSFPISTKWNVGVSLKPYSFVDFENEYARIVPGTPYYAYYITSGKGGINKASLNNAVQIGKYLSLGIEATYFFGNIRRGSEVQIPLPFGEGGNYMVGLNERTTVSDFSFRGGAAVRIPIKKDNKLFLNVGGTYSLGSQLASTQTVSFELTQGGSNVVAPDTLDNNLGGSMTLPTQYQAGLSLEWPYKLILSADFNHQGWSGYKSFSNSNDGLRSINRINLGAEYLPNISSLSYFNLVRYRIGFSTGPTPYVVNGTGINDTNVSLGLTFPMGGRFSNYISVAFLAGQRGTGGAGMIKERYGRVILGLTLMDRWFQKQKLE
ncbi:hypothetical protein DYBT9275_00875 [Dyadobacter sp. CECT 9275]|uniref:Long-chain fatty acid transport protein n=1 Tax=Dyadobacter helix TaxID=2822344 RepID=A0A916N2W6_9BACT|nr:hypothetical protein DYBT9275_00875 [Dyadobacter sp. CECT 9275]